ncbi:response regulator containing a -like receiver domain protein and an hth dna-binding domain protein [Leptolyngbya sp. Heron Island J]|uniref:LuxR C-terminal-related transcriptional regulator n=1 Tax=Leptolyngbya sp. Heron Island J TaxID=1385935 RepID=UPI0003B9A6EC|nr:LuxR C-terminal-related transcriptional regulator [Leptolyngbya sp. Heron Island J]ESA35581.1 response regulator containing a -like receiver domain protein and an hth dna-binding domain protein [Leptolyngbya sp. Heron Island J]
MATQTQIVPQMAPSQAAVMSDHNDSFNMQAALLVAAIENFTFGLIIVTQDGTILHKNKRAQMILKEMSCPSSSSIPDLLWHPCQSLLENQDEASELLPTDYTIVLEDEILTDHSTIHMRVQWFDWNNEACQVGNCFLITLEDRQQSLAVIANHEAQRYGLTTRETDVWCLKRKGSSYKEIARALFISENTVKKHLKNVYSKKEQFSGLNEL